MRKLPKRICFRLDGGLYDDVRTRVGGAMRMSDVCRLALISYLYSGRKD